MGAMKNLSIELMNMVGQGRFEEIQLCPIIKYIDKDWYYDGENKILINPMNYKDKIKFERLTPEALLWIEDTIDWLDYMEKLTPNYNGEIQ